jgi:PAS domain S-box-containing protein
MTPSLQQDFLQKLKNDKQSYAFNSKLYGEFYIDAADSKVSWASPGLLELLAYPTDKFGQESMDIRSLIHLADVHEFDNTLEAGLSGKWDGSTFRIRLKRGDDNYQFCSVRAQVVTRNENGQAMIFHGVAFPDAAPSINKVGLEEDAYSSMLLNTLPDTLFVLNKSGLILDHRKGNRMEDFDALASSYIGSSLEAVFPDFLSAHFFKQMAEMETEKGSTSFEYSLDWDHGTAYYECHLNKLNGELFLAVIQNATSRKHKDQLLREVFERRRIFIEQSPNAIAMLDKDLRYLAVSNKWISDYGLQDKSIIGEKHFDIFKNAPTKWKSNAKAALMGITSKVDVEQYTRHDGASMMLKWEVRPWHVNDDSIGGVIVLTEDITDQQRIANENKRLSTIQQVLMKISARFIDFREEELDEVIHSNLAELARHVNADRAYIFKYDWNSNSYSNTHEWCNEGVESQMDELQGLDNAWSPEWVEAHKRGEEVYIADVANMAEGTIKDLLIPQKIKSLVTIPLVHNSECIGFLGFDAIKEAEAFPEKERELLSIFAGMLVNALSRILAQSELATTKSQLEGILLEMKDVIWSLSAQGSHTVFLSPSVKRLVGKPAEVCQQSPFWWEEFIHPDDRYITDGLLRDLKEHGHYSGEHRIIASNGKLKWVHARGRIIYNAQGRAERIDAVISDITEQKQNEEKVKALLGVANDQNERFRNFANIVTHNLQGNASNISMLLNLWKEEEDAQQKALFFETLEGASENLNATIKDLNEVTTYTTTTDTALRPLQLKEAVIGALKGLQGAIIKANAQIIIEVDESIRVEGVPAYLESILYNLISNAVKYRSPDRKLEVKLSTQLKGDYCVVFVQDNGLGIDLNRHRAKLYGFHNTFHGNADARGIGLFITKNQVMAMGGKIELASKQGVGSVFKVFLKASDPSVAPAS